MRLNFILLLVGFGLTSCEKEFYAHPLDPRLPHNTAVGANAAGAYVNGTPWITRRTSNFWSGQNREGNFNVYYDIENESTFLEFREGKLFIQEISDPISICFRLKNQILTEPQDFLNLINTTLVLDGVHNYGEIHFYREHGVDTVKYGMGQLHIREVICEESCIVAGTFGFETELPNEPNQIFSGRFDYRMYEGNFGIYH